MRTCLAISTIFLSGSTLANSNNEKFSIYPEVYQNVFNDDNNANSINSQSAQTGFDNIYETVNEDLKHTTQCINSLTLDQAKECHTKGQKYVEDNLNNGWPFISFGKRDFLAKARFRNIFVPQYIEKTLGMMIFDASFKYFGEFGFHEHAIWTINNCAEIMCEKNSTEINKELVAANTKYNKKNAEGLAGNHYGIDWSKMVETYNVNGLASPSDNYNLWMPGLEEGEQFHKFNFNITQLSLDDNERKSWYTAMRFAIIHHFHHFYLFGEEGLFTMGYQTSETELLNEAEKQFKDSTLMEEEFLQKFANMQARNKFTVGKMRTYNDFKQRVHVEGINYMLNRETNYEKFIFELAKPTTWFRTSLMKTLGFKETPERIVKMQNLADSLYSLKTTLWEIELKNEGKYVKTMFVMALPYAILWVFMIILLCKGWPYYAVIFKMLAAVCRVIFCIKKQVEPEEEDELLSMYADRFGRPSSKASTRNGSRPASKQQGRKIAPEEVVNKE